MSRRHHNDGPECHLCNGMLRDAHPYLQEWWKRVKAAHESAHLSCVWRGASDQNKAYLDGKSRARWPHSKHNVTTPKGEPYSLALDVFQIDADGVARFSWLFYKLIDKENREAREPIIWGGNFKAISDGCHFELSQPAAVQTDAA